MKVFRSSSALSSTFVIKSRLPGVLPINSHLPALTVESAHADEHTTRKPILLLRSSGLFLLRLAERQFLGLLCQEPPRS